MRNTKREAFDLFLKEENLECFEIKELKDEDGTVIYRSYIQTEWGELPVFVILDNSIYAIIRVTVGYGVVTEDNTAALSMFLNEENAKYKSFKFYIEKEDNSLYLDCIYMTTEGHFEPPLLYVLMSQLVEYIPTVHGRVTELIGVKN